ncbi:uncharacterized protein LOC132027675 [Mustela nigripes]|uniref:Uncharacterized protein LOC106004497 n=1 Tax=Mustela putorius furo TaxID=9669 RepID=A0A8U0SHI8_MUSPF|nr:uncharacterized protein LOC106004497 [Mustela putorius furo]XP_059272415.1 uncharacterized protein LOC132027675 [Mustela nigripes]
MRLGERSPLAALDDSGAAFQNRLSDPRPGRRFRKPWARAPCGSRERQESRHSSRGTRSPARYFLGLVWLDKLRARRRGAANGAPGRHGARTSLVSAACRGKLPLYKASSPPGLAVVRYWRAGREGASREDGVRRPAAPAAGRQQCGGVLPDRCPGPAAGGSLGSRPSLPFLVFVHLKYPSQGWPRRPRKTSPPSLTPFVPTLRWRLNSQEPSAGGILVLPGACGREWLGTSDSGAGTYSSLGRAAQYRRWGPPCAWLGEDGRVSAGKGRSWTQDFLKPFCRPVCVSAPGQTAT